MSEIRLPITRGTPGGDGAERFLRDAMPAFRMTEEESTL
jgi:hypothetical protein